jgi:hypothetical protein
VLARLNDLFIGDRAQIPARARLLEPLELRNVGVEQAAHLLAGGKQNRKKREEGENGPSHASVPFA